MSGSEGGLLLLGVAALVLVVVVLESRRQKRRYGPASGRPNLVGVGMLELQKHLQADRRTETLVEIQRDDAAATETDTSTEVPPRPPAR